jgi:3-hydroxyisobutyrate dehydrogenase-like beta-hydroxyacid dehydrogenase
MLSTTAVGLIGYGEVGKIFAAALKAAGAPEVSAWDVRFADPAQADAQFTHTANAGVHACTSMNELMRRSALVFSAVTANQTLAAASEAAACIRAGCVFVDLNSASPHTKVQCAAQVDAAGGRYIEAGVMTAVPPYGIRAPMLLGGPHAAEFAPALQVWGLDAKAVSAQLGVASAIKMCRSVIIKGLEALVVESFTAARAHGVEDAVLASLQQTFPGLDWERQGNYFFERVIQHGRRRAEEMREAAATMQETGIGAHMAAASAERQAWMAELALRGVFSGPGGAWRARADAVLAALSAAQTSNTTPALRDPAEAADAPN